MLLSDCEKQAMALMAHYGLDSWSFTFDNAVRRFGACNYTYRRISLSRSLVQLNSPEVVGQTVLHEIAHAIAGPSHNHDHIWLATARSLGYTGGRTYERTVIRPQGKYEAECDCPLGIHSMNRRPRLQYRCRVTKTPLVFKRV